MQPDPGQLRLVTTGLWLGVALVGCGAGAAPDAREAALERAQPDRGLRLIALYQCGRCHTIPGAAGTSRPLGPPLEAFGRRSYIAGRIPNTPAALRQWLQEPQSLVPQTTMPDVGVSPADARDIAAYLLSLR